MSVVFRVCLTVNFIGWVVMSTRLIFFYCVVEADEA